VVRFIVDFAGKSWHEPVLEVWYETSPGLFTFDEFGESEVDAKAYAAHYPDNITANVTLEELVESYPEGVFWADEVDG